MHAVARNEYVVVQTVESVYKRGRKLRHVENFVADTADYGEIFADRSVDYLGIKRAGRIQNVERLVDARYRP